MTRVAGNRPGRFCWTELASTDIDSAKSFYGDLFQWASTEVPMGEAAQYTMFNRQGTSVAGGYSLTEEQVTQGVPPFWALHVAVADVDASAAKADSSGGRTLMGPMDVMDSGRLALIQDPTGANLGLWQAKDRAGAEMLMQEPGSISWTELMTDDIDAAAGFYGKLFGWQKDTQAMPNGDYITFKIGDEDIAGMMAIPEDMKGMPPNWMVYFAVTGCDAACASAAGSGGTVAVPTTDIPGVGRFAVLQDAQGATFSVLEAVEMLVS